MGQPRAWAGGAVAGATAAGAMLGAAFLVRSATGLPTLPEATSDGVVRLLPGRVFGYLIDRLQEHGRPLFLLALSLAVITAAALAGTGLALCRQRWASRWAVGAQIALLTALLWALSLPLVLLGGHRLLSQATAVTLADWLVAVVLTEAALTFPSGRRGVHGSAVPAPNGSGPLVLPNGGPAASLGPARAPGRLAATGRREFLEVLGGGAALATLGYLGAKAASAAAPRDVFGDLSGVTPTYDFYVVSKNLAGDPVIDAGDWQLRVEGERAYSLGFTELLGAPHVDQPQTLECISNLVGGPLISTGVWRGVPLRHFLERAGVPRGTVEVAFRSWDGYTESLPLQVALDPSTLVADHLNGGLLPHEHGYPARILVADRYGMKCPKWLTEVWPLSHPFTGYYEHQGWSEDAIVNTTSRIDYPLNMQIIKAGPMVPVRGIAYAGSRGISKVEISLDDGSTWRPVTVYPAASRYAWSVWTYAWRPGKGTFTLMVRATDGQGNLQSSWRSRGTFPNGAVGLANVIVIVD